MCCRSWLPPTNPNLADDDKDPRVNVAPGPPNQDPVDYVTMESLATLEAFAPGLIENQ